jgi:flavin reductase (DIM6/NTAB) family NADH-FMN oxidoreductase RutF
MKNESDRRMHPEMDKIAAGADASKALRQLYGCFPTGVTALCALRDGVPLGLALSSFTSVSIDPPLVSVSLQSVSSTWASLGAVTTFGLSVLSETQDQICRQMSQKNGDRFLNLPWTSTASGAVFIHGAVAWLECMLHHRFAAGDHEIAILRVEAAKADPARPPLVFHDSRFHRLVPHGDVAA